MERKPIHSQQILKSRRQELRNNATPEERILWQRLRGKQLDYKFQRQHSIGPYIVDFYCAEKKLVIELDGNHHLGNQEYDKERKGYLESLGIREMRFWNEEVKNDSSQMIAKIGEYLK